MRQQLFTVTMTSGALSSPVVTMGVLFQKVYVDVPSMPSGSLQMLASYDNSVYKNLHNPVGSNANTIWSVNSAVVANGGFFEVPAGFQYYKLESTSGVTQVTNLINFIGVY